MKKTFGKVALCLAGFAFDMLLVHIFDQPVWVASLIAVKFLALWAIIWICSVVAESRLGQMLTVGAGCLTFVYAFCINNPGVTAGAERWHAVLNHDSSVSAVASTVRTYNEIRCDGFVGKFFANDPLNPQVEIVNVGYTQHPDGSFGCYDLTSHLDNPGVDGNGKEIHRVTHPIANQIIAQVERENAEKAEQIAAAQRAAAIADAAAQEQRRIAAQTPEPIATTTPEPPKERCAVDNHVVIATRDELDLSKNYTFLVHLQNPLRDSEDTLLAERAAPVILTVNVLQENRRGSADIDMEVTSIGDSTVHARIVPITREPKKRGKHQYTLPSGVLTFVTMQPICLPTASVMTASLNR